jgi:hypothetical protein
MVSNVNLKRRDNMAQIVHEMDMDAYHEHPAISKTNLYRFWKCATPAHYLAYEEPEKDHLNFGSVVHMAVLEPDLYNEKVVVAPVEVLNKAGGRSGKKWTEWKEYQDQAGKSILTPDEKKAVEFMLESIARNSEAKDLLSGKYSEVSFFWNDFDTRHEMKCRPDHLPGNEIIVDLKTAVSAEPQWFGKQAANLKYHWSAAITTQGITECTQVKHTDYRFVVVEKDPPYGVAVYQCMAEDIDLAKMQMYNVKERLVECLTKDEWPCYPSKTMELMLPYWERKTAAGSIFD